MKTQNGLWRSTWLHGPRWSCRTVPYCRSWITLSPPSGKRISTFHKVYLGSQCLTLVYFILIFWHIFDKCRKIFHQECKLFLHQCKKFCIKVNFYCCFVSSDINFFGNNAAVAMGMGEGEGEGAKRGRYGRGWQEREGRGWSCSRHHRHRLGGHAAAAAAPAAVSIGSAGSSVSGMPYWMTRNMTPEDINLAVESIPNPLEGQILPGISMQQAIEVNVWHHIHDRHYQAIFSWSGDKG